jgi:hypothetical protein
LIRFDEKTHSYYGENGKRYTSVTQLLKPYTPPFDPDGFIIKAVAKKEGVAEKDIRYKWNKERDEACDKGNRLHASIEALVKKEKPADEKIIEDFIRFKKENITGKLTAEEILYNDFYEVAGTADLPERFKHRVNVWDYKTNKKIEYHNKYGVRMLGDLDFLEDCNYNKYSLQLSLYAKLLELKGLSVGKLTILWFDSEYKVHPIPVPYMRDTAELILNNHLEKL